MTQWPSDPLKPFGTPSKGIPKSSRGLVKTDTPSQFLQIRPCQLFPTVPTLVENMEIAPNFLN